MTRIRLAAAIVVPIIVVIAAATGMALAQSPPGELVPVVLDGQPPPRDAAGGRSVTLSARLHGQDGSPARGETLVFYVLSTVFGERLMKVGQAVTDSTGTAALLYEPTWEGEHTVVVRYAGGATRAPAQTTFRMTAAGPPHVHENARFGLEAVRRQAPLGAGLAVLAVWSVLGLVVFRTVRGIPAAAQTPGVAPLPALVLHAPHAAPLRPAPLRPLLLAMAALTVVAVSIGWFQSRGGRVALRVSDVNGLASSGNEPINHNAPASSNEPLKDRVFPATQVQFVPGATTNAEGQLTPDSADLPADVALLDGRVFVLDTNNGRILTVTPDQKLARMFESDRGGATSILGASAMTDHEGDLYVAAPLFGAVVVLSSAGKVEEVVRIEVPQGAHPFSPSGIAVTDEGQIWLSDPDNHRVVSVNERGRFLWSIGEGAVASGSYGLDTPAGLAVDALGNLWVADTGNHEVKKYSPMGVFLATVGHDQLARPRAVAVDDAGNVFVSDDELSAVLAFAPDGAFLGSFGNSAAGGTEPSARLHAPDGIEVAEGRVYVMDRLSGLFVFKVGATDVP